jgi:hypothetical protein
MTQVKEIALPLIKDSKDKKVTADKPDILDSVPMQLMVLLVLA